MDPVWTNVDPFCPYFTNLFAAVAKTNLMLSFKANFSRQIPTGFPWMIQGIIYDNVSRV